MRVKLKLANKNNKKKTTDKKQNERLANIERAIHKLSLSTKRKLPKPSKKKDKANSRTITGQITQPDLKIPASITSPHIAASSLPITQVSRTVLSQSANNHDILFFLPFRPLRIGVPNIPAHTLGMRIINDSGSYGIVNIEVPEVINNVITESMVDIGQDMWKVNDASAILRFDGSHAFRMGRCFVFNPPTWQQGETVRDSLGSWLSLQNITTFRDFVNTLMNNRFTRAYNFNTTQEVEEKPALRHEWSKFDDTGDSTYLHNSDSVSASTISTISWSGNSYVIPHDCMIMYIPGVGSGATVFPSFTMHTRAVTEVELHRHPGLLSPTPPPSQLVSDIAHQTRALFTHSSAYSGHSQSEAAQEVAKQHPALFNVAKALTSKKALRVEEGLGAALLMA